MTAKSLAVIKEQPVRQCANIRELLMNKGAEDQLRAVATKHMNPERMMRVVANAIRTTPTLSDCEPMSFLGALMMCASLGLEPNTILGHAYLVPFKNNRKNVTEVQVIVGYKGLIDLARRSGHITSISANIHYSDDDLWDYEEGTDARLRHRPGSRKGGKLHAYAVAKFTDGGHAFVVLPWSEVMARRDGSQNWKSAVRYGKQASNPWATHEDAMAMKTAIRSLSKYLPLSIEFMQAVEMDEANLGYADFAMNQEGGLIQQEDEQGGGEVIEGKAEKGTDKKTAPAAKAEARPEQNVKAEAKNEGEQTAKAPEAVKEAAPAAADKPDPRHQKTYDATLNDMMDGGYQATLDFRAEALAAMQAEAPDLYARLMDEAEQFRPSEQVEG